MVTVNNTTAEAAAKPAVRKKKGMNAFRRAVAGITLGGMLGYGGVALAATALVTLSSCENPLQGELDDAKKKIKDLEGQIADLNARLETKSGELADKQAELDTLAQQISDLTDDVAELEEAKTALQTQLADAGAAFAAEQAALQAQIDDLDGQITAKNQTISNLTTAKDALTSEKNAIEAEKNLLTRQLDVALVGGQLHNAAWFTQHDANVAAAQTLGNELTTVFVGDGVVRQIWDNASGVIDNATAIGKFSYLKTSRAFVIGAAGDNIGDIKYRLGYRKNAAGQIVRDQAAATEMPAKPAYIVSHAGQREVELSGLGTTNDTIKAMGLGQDIGAFYAWIKAEYSNSSTIFSGIVPISSIGTNNTNDLNGEIQTAIGDTTGTTNRCVGTVYNTTTSGIINGINLTLYDMTGNGMTAILRQKSGVRLAFEPFRAPVNTGVTVTFFTDKFLST